MKTKSFFLFLLISVLLGCSSGPKPPTLHEVVASWGDLGMYLPSAMDVALIRDRLPESLETLKAGLKDERKHVRKSSAYVIEKLGTNASLIAVELIGRLEKEQDAVNRTYIASAVAALGELAPDGIRRLEKCFQSEQQEQAKTDIAGALVRLGLIQSQRTAWEWLLKSLETFPPEPPDKPSAQHIFWERRWGAVKHLRTISGQDETVLPLLRTLESHPKTPHWVIQQQIAPAISEIQTRLK